MRRLIRAAASVVVIAAVATIPLVLSAIAVLRFGSPVPWAGIGSPAEWSPTAIAEVLSRPVGDDLLVDVMIRVGLIIGWIVVIIVVIEIPREYLHRRRHGDQPRRPVKGLSVPRAVARFIAAGLIVTTGHFGVARAAMPIASFVPDQHQAVSAALMAELSGPEVGPSAPPSPIQHVVRSGESLLDIAARYHRGAGEFDFALAILRANQGSTMSDGQRFMTPLLLEPGWTLSIPSVGGPKPNVVIDADPVVRTHQVAPGDTLWAIAELHLGEPRRWPEIWELNAHREMSPGRIFDDPALIIPGWVLELPATDPEVVPESAAAIPPPPPAPPSPPSFEVVAPEVTTVPPPSFEAVAPEVTTVPPPMLEPSAVVPTIAAQATVLPATSLSVPVPQTTVLRDPAARDERPIPDMTPVAPPAGAQRSGQLIAIGGSLLVGSALFAIEGVRRRRLRAASIRSRAVIPPLPSQRIERRLRALGDTERLVRLDLVIRAATARLIADEIPVLMVSMAPDGAAEVIPLRNCPTGSPWTSRNDVWRLPAHVGDDELLQIGIGTASPTVSLVQIGVGRSGEEIYLDLEAAGHLVVRGSSIPETSAVLTSILANLQLSPFSEIDEIVVVGDLPALEHGPTRLRHLSTIDELERYLDDLPGVPADISPFALRCRARGGERWEPTIVIAPGPFDAADARRLAVLARRSSVTIVAADTSADSCADGQPGTDTGPAVVVRRVDDSWLVETSGRAPVEVDLVQIRPDDLSMLDMALDQSGYEVVEELAGSASLPNDVSTDTDDASTVVSLPAEPTIIVRLFGPTDVVDPLGHSIRFDRARSVELLAWMVTHRHRSTRSAARTAMWEIDVRDATFANIVSDARRSLFRAFAPPDGREWIERTLTDDLPLHPSIVSDAQLLERALDAVREHSDGPGLALMIRQLEDRLVGVRGLPFEGTAYLWPDAEGLSSGLVLLVISAVGVVAEYHLERNDVAGVFSATDIGLRVLPAHEELIALRLRAHLAVGDLAGARHEWDSYLRVLARDPWADVEPAPALVALRNEIQRCLAAPSRVGGHRDRPD